jgi:acyl-CoA reductase-like NAD-dependent aldehyde dehydrogenase
MGSSPEKEGAKFPPEIYEGLHIPKGKKPIKTSVKEVIIKKKMTDEQIEAKEGHYFDEDDVDKIYDEIAPTGEHALALITREPMGVVGAVVPWNYPMIMTAWKLGPALAAGNSVVLKPAEQSPYTALRIAASPD